MRNIPARSDLIISAVGGWLIISTGFLGLSPIVHPLFERFASFLVSIFLYATPLVIPFVLLAAGFILSCMTAGAVLLVSGLLTRIRHAADPAVPRERFWRIVGGVLLAQILMGLISAVVPPGGLGPTGIVMEFIISASLQIGGILWGVGRK